jgi:hypothetical protein
MNKKYAIAIVATGIALLLAACAAYIVFVKIPTDLATNIANGMKDAFNFTPQVKVAENVVIEQSAPIFEVATITRDLSVDYSWSHEWLGSTKKLSLRGVFTAKAGFDLKEPFSISVQKYPRKVTAIMPRPKVLSLQMNSYKILLDDSGWWNTISDADREAAVAELQRIARTEAENSGMLTEASSTIEARLKEIVERNGAVLELKYPWQE